MVVVNVYLRSLRSRDTHLSMTDKSVGQDPISDPATHAYINLFYLRFM